MKRIFKKNQIIITTLAIMIAVAGYLNYSGRILEDKADTVSSDDSTVLLKEEGLTDSTYSDTYTDIVSLDGDGTQEVSSAQNQTATVGEAVLASASAGDDILAAAKLNREQAHAKSKENLESIINNSSIDESQKQDAIDQLARLSDRMEKQTAAEELLATKGFLNSVVTINDDTVDVVVTSQDLAAVSKAQIEDAVSRTCGCDLDQIVITKMKLSEE